MNFKRGFSLIEVSVSLLILSVAVMSVYQTLSSTTLSIFSLENRVIAREIANNRISLINTLEKPFNQKTIWSKNGPFINRKAAEVKCAK